MKQRNAMGQGGFTLAEMLVAMALLAVLAAVVLPSVLGQLNKGEVSRISNDLKSVAQAAKSFYSDVQRYPAGLTHLASAIGSASVDVDNQAYGVLHTRWEGPYLERLDVTSGLETGFEATIDEDFDVQVWTTGGQRFFTIDVNNITASDAEKVDEAIDGAVGLSAGQIRHASTTLTFYAMPFIDS